MCLLGVLTLLMIRNSRVCAYVQRTGGAECESAARWPCRAYVACVPHLRQRQSFSCMLLPQLATASSFSSCCLLLCLRFVFLSVLKLLAERARSFKSVCSARRSKPRLLLARACRRSRSRKSSWCAYYCVVASCIGPQV